ncbi:non-ribosomal peptide synthetase [Flavobacterium franklandianum]|uniref:Amino acid adenylation domain-containing protein n=1 Tax=Flavobacterium franklandianum TaxID=2594430 RepID=A0A553CR25_9FLAO|nr:non-ribosomal peptide synthetase [Flavobacterium franklandianum]TRX22986.1 amino acid adenylation domain-containing protein [Flavobacterium franklandianum]
MNDQSNTHNKNQLIPLSGDIETVIYTTKSQSEIWTSCYFGGNDANRAFNLLYALDFDGLLDSKVMKIAFQTLVNRHESLRATFSNDGIQMSIFKNLPIAITNLDLSNFEKKSQIDKFDHCLNEEAHYVFDLVNGPLLRVSLIKISDVKHSLIINIHHIICDGWSIGVILEELGIIYSALIENKTPLLPVSIAFSEYAEEEQLFINSNEYKEIEKYWFSLYEQSIPVVNLPTDNPRPSIRTYESERLDFSLDAQLVASLKKIGLIAGTSLITTILASFEVYLCQLTGQNDIAVGVPAAGQPVTGMNELVGHCVNLLPLRSTPEPNISFIDYLNQRKIELFDAYDNQQLSFGQLLQKLNVARDPSRIPLVPVAFNMGLDLTDDVAFSNLNFKLINTTRSFETFEIFLNASGSEKNLVLEWSFNKVLFKPETIKKMMVSFEQVLQKIVEDPSKTLEQITFQDYTSKKFEISGPKMSYPKSTLHELFAKQAEIYPNSIALEFEDKQITYGDLSTMINQMANYLWSQGLRPGQIVAISLERTPELITSLFAVLQCGASYVPIDTNYPDARLNIMIEDSDAAFYIGLNSKRNFPNKAVSLSIGTILESMVDLPVAPINLMVPTESAAYIIYTSGSTGKPKGVQVAHCNVINLVYSMAKEPGISATDKIFSITTISFDAMVMEIFLPLLHGACVVLVDEETRRDGNLLLEKAAKDKITMMWGTSSIWHILIDSGWKEPLNIKALIGGEPVPIPLAKELLSRCNELWNIYGPTETTVCSFLTQITINDNPITIGTPIANTNVYLLDANRKPVNEGQVGEIVIAGDGVSLGYLNRPDLNNERFLTNTFNRELGGKMYLSGDLGKLLPNGHVQCLGRIDHQVKVRGYRIELGEIEEALLSIDGIKSAIVIAETDILIAFIEADYEITNEQDQIRLWRNELAAQLPTFMVPHDFNILEKLPTTLSGKIDRKALLNYKSNKIVQYTEPRTETEKIVETIWKESLKREKIDIFSNFFEIGGHSLIAVRVMNKIEQQTGKKLPLSALFEHSTIEQLAKLLNTDREIYSEHLVPIKPQGTKPPLFIIHGAGLNVLNFIHIVSHFDDDQPVYGIQGIGPNGYDNWFESIEDMAACYIESIIKINPKGPYALAGFSFGGVVAFEMARQLKEQGKTVSIVALLDTYADLSYYYTASWQKKLMRIYDNNSKRLSYLIEMLTSWKAFKIRTQAKKEHILKMYFGQKDILSEQEALALEEFTVASSMVNKIVDRYQLKPQNCGVDLFRAKDDKEYKLDPIFLGWKKAALKGVNIHDIPGDHLAIVDPPNDEILARMLQDILDERHSNI